MLFNWQNLRFGVEVVDISVARMPSYASKYRILDYLQLGDVGVGDGCEGRLSWLISLEMSGDVEGEGDHGFRVTTGLLVGRTS